MANARERNRGLFDGRFGAVYGFYIERERLVRVVACALWGSDPRPYYASMRVVGDQPDGATIVDCPCGSGVAMRALAPSQRVRYLAFDLSPGMLERGRRRAAKCGLPQPVFAEADATKLPVPPNSVDLFLSYFGLHCLDEPDAALREAARCLRAGGRLVGSTIVRGPRRLDRLRVRPHVAGFGAVGDESALGEWLVLAGLHEITIQTCGSFAVFHGTKDAS
jgi:SAM-dependent methyltransferase